MGTDLRSSTHHVGNYTPELQYRPHLAAEVPGSEVDDAVTAVFDDQLVDVDANRRQELVLLRLHGLHVMHTLVPVLEQRQEGMNEGMKE